MYKEEHEAFQFPDVISTCFPLGQSVRQMARITGISRRGAIPAIAVGWQKIDGVLPGAAFARGRYPRDGRIKALTSFPPALLGRQQAIQHVLWVMPNADLFPYGLSQLGLPHRFLTVAWARQTDNRL